MSCILKGSGIKIHTEKVEICEKELVQRHANTNRLTQKEGVSDTEGPKPYKFIRDKTYLPHPHPHSLRGVGEDLGERMSIYFYWKKPCSANALNDACHTPPQCLVGSEDPSHKILRNSLRILRRHSNGSGTFKKDKANHLHVDIVSPCLPDYNA